MAKARLPDQPIFYPVLSEEYAVKIARDWNVPASGRGFVTRFRVRKNFLDSYEVREAGGRGFWMKRNQIGLGEVLGPEDFVLVDWDGLQIAGSGGRHSEWPIHSEIFRARADVNAGHSSRTSGRAPPITLSGVGQADVVQRQHAWFGGDDLRDGVDGRVGGCRGGAPRPVDWRNRWPPGR